MLAQPPERRRLHRIYARFLPGTTKGTKKKSPVFVCFVCLCKVFAFGAAFFRLCPGCAGIRAGR